MTGAEADDLASVFGLLSDGTRVDIVRALAERRFEESGRPGLSFSELRNRVGARDAGRFNYHLARLRGSLVEKTAEGYLLTDAGVSVGVLVLDANPLTAPA